MGPINSLAILALFTSALAAPQGIPQGYGAPQLEPYGGATTSTAAATYAPELEPYGDATTATVAATSAPELEPYGGVTKPTAAATYAPIAHHNHTQSASASVSRNYGSLSHSGKKSHKHHATGTRQTLHVTLTTTAEDSPIDSYPTGDAPQYAASTAASPDNAPAYSDSPAAGAPTSSNQLLTAAATGLPTPSVGCDAVVTKTERVTVYVTEGQEQSHTTADAPTSSAAATTELTTTVFSTRTTKVTQTTTLVSTASSAASTAGAASTAAETTAFSVAETSSDKATAAATTSAVPNYGIPDDKAPTTAPTDVASTYAASSKDTASSTTHSTEAAPVSSALTTSAKSHAVEATTAKSSAVAATSPATSSQQAPTTTVATTSSAPAPTTSAYTTSAEVHASAAAATTTTSSAGGLLGGLIPSITIPSISIPTILGGSSAHSGKRGLAYNDASLCSAFKNSNEISWAYNWGVSSAGLSLPGVKYIPTMWGNKPDFTNGWNAKAKAAIAAGSDVIFSFNEPDHPDQSNMSPSQAADMYRQYMNPLAGLGAKLCAPSVTNGVKTASGAPMGLPWLTEFLKQCTDCKIDCINIHWYDSASNVQYFKDHVTEAHTIGGGLPVYVSEFGAVGSPSPSASQVSTFLQAVMPWMDSQSWVAGYAYFMVAEGNLLSGVLPSLFGSTYMSSS